MRDPLVCTCAQDAAFDPSSSSSSVKIPCGSEKCMCGRPPCGCSDTQECTYQRTYGARGSYPLLHYRYEAGLSMPSVALDLDKTLVSLPLEAAVTPVGIAGAPWSSRSTGQNRCRRQPGWPQLHTEGGSAGRDAAWGCPALQWSRAAPTRRGVPCPAVEQSSADTSWGLACRAAEQSSSSGMLVSDLLQLRDGGVEVVFGCETKETGEIFNQEADGILGLGNSEVSLVNQVGARPARAPMGQCWLPVSRSLLHPGGERQPGGEGKRVHRCARQRRLSFLGSASMFRLPQPSATLASAGWRREACALLRTAAAAELLGRHPCDPGRHL